MTRINCIDPVLLTDQHLIAEYRELPRALTLAAGVAVNIVMHDSIALDEAKHKLRALLPSQYTMGTGHVKFFYDKTRFLFHRHQALVNEMKRRGFQVNIQLPESAMTSGLDNNWHPDEQAVLTNVERLRVRLQEKPGFYTYCGRKVDSKFY